MSKIFYSELYTRINRSIQSAGIEYLTVKELQMNRNFKSRVFAEAEATAMCQNKRFLNVVKLNLKLKCSFIVELIYKTFKTLHSIVSQFSIIRQSSLTQCNVATNQ